MAHSHLLEPKNLQCWNCGAEHALGLSYECVACGFPLSVAYEDASTTTSPKFSDTGFAGMWKYFPVLPVSDSDDIVTLGEGNTPLVRCETLGGVYGLEQLWVKAEYANPTGSFKDRPISAAMSMAREFRVNGVVTSSSGNAGAAVAAYSARAGLHSYVFVPEATAPSKLLQINAAGATLVRIRGTVSDAFHSAKEVATRLGWMNLTSTYICPYTIEGDKTIAYELQESLGSQVPKWILVPIGAGPLLAGIYKGYQELLRLGQVDTLPRMVGIQAQGCNPIAEAYRTGAESVQTHDRPRTIAGGIADPLKGYNCDGTVTLRIIRQSGGLVADVSDEAIIQGMRTAASTEGLFLEPSAAAGVAGLAALASSELFSPEDLTVVIATAGGLKTPEAWLTGAEPAEAIDPTYEAFSKTYGQNAR